MAKEKQTQVDIELDVAQRASNAVRAQTRALTRELEALRAHQFLSALTSSVEREGERYDWARVLVNDQFPDGPPRARLLPAMIEKAQLALEELSPVAAAANDNLHIAKRAKSSAVAMELQPRHLKATREVAEALEALNSALAEVDQVLIEFRSRSPEHSSPLLPDICEELADCRLDRWDSRAARWARKMRTMKVLP